MSRLDAAVFAAIAEAIHDLGTARVITQSLVAERIADALEKADAGFYRFDREAFTARATRGPDL